MAGIHLDDSAMTTRLDAVVNWARKNSLWPLPFGTACCAIEFMSMMASRYDFSRFGAEALRFSPRQSDLLLVLGTVTNKQAPVLRQIYAQMAEPKWVVAVGVCASTGGHVPHLRHPPGHRPGGAGGRLRPRLPAPPGDHDLRSHGTAEEDQPGIPDGPQGAHRAVLRSPWPGRRSCSRLAGCPSYQVVREMVLEAGDRGAQRIW